LEKKKKGPHPGGFLSGWRGRGKVGLFLFFNHPNGGFRPVGRAFAFLWGVGTRGAGGGGRLFYKKKTPKVKLGGGQVLGPVKKGGGRTSAVKRGGGGDTPPTTFACFLRGGRGKKFVFFGGGGTPHLWGAGVGGEKGHKPFHFPLACGRVLWREQKSGAGGAKRQKKKNWDNKTARQQN